MTKPLLTHRPVTRRDFLAQGFLGLATTYFAPSLFGFGKKAFAANPRPPIPFLVFDCAGGASLSGNFLVGKSGGPKDFLTSYSKLGWDPANGKVADGLDESLGLPMFRNVSKIREGIVTTASAQARAKLRLGSFCHYSQDDGDYGIHNAAALVTKAGFQGQWFKGGLGRSTTNSGGRTQTAEFDPTFKPLTVTSVADVTGVFTYGPAFADLPAEVRTLIGSTTKRISASQKRRFERWRRGNAFATASTAAYDTTERVANGVTGLDPRADAIFREVYGLEADTDSKNEAAISAALVMNVLRRNSGPGVFEIDGCDYHDGTKETGDAKDLSIGQQIGRAVESAHRLRTPLFFELLSDGSVYSDDNTRKWRSDDGTKSLTVIGYYNPDGPAQQPRLQVGHYTNDQGVERRTFIGDDSSKIAHAVLANYLNVQGRLTEYERIVARSQFTARELDSLLVLA